MNVRRQPSLVTRSASGELVSWFVCPFHSSLQIHERRSGRITNATKGTCCDTVALSVSTVSCLLKREGWNVNAKRIYRLYSEERLSLQTKKPRPRVGCQAREDRPEATGINDCWAMDFMSDELYADRRIRLLTIVDHFTRESLAIDVSQRMRGNEVVSVLECLACHRKFPKAARVDNGPKFRSKVLDQWAYSNGVSLDLSRSGKPMDNAFIESFNCSLRAECLYENWFLSLSDAKQKIEAW